jgi:hypothetical protein
MASAAQITANRANAQLSTGPRTEAGKAAVAQNRVTHGLASREFFLIPGESCEEFNQLLAEYTAEHQPAGPTESFLVRELAQAQWKLRRIAEIESGLLDGGGSPLAELFRADAADSQAILKLSRYENAIRRNWYKALAELRALRRESTRASAVQARCERAQADNRFTRLLEEATTIPAAPPQPVNSSKPMPPHLQRELEAHRRRDPLFDPAMDASQMSKELRRWFDTHPTTTTP